MLKRCSSKYIGNNAAIQFLYEEVKIWGNFLGMHYVPNSELGMGWAPKSQALNEYKHWNPEYEWARACDLNSGPSIERLFERCQAVFDQPKFEQPNLSGPNLSRPKFEPTQIWANPNLSQPNFEQAHFWASQIWAGPFLSQTNLSKPIFEQKNSRPIWIMGVDPDAPQKKTPHQMLSKNWEGMWAQRLLVKSSFTHFKSGASIRLG